VILLVKKAQTALEYLMTYGWAILIIIIVGAALYALGVFSPGTFTGKRSTGFSGFQINDFKLAQNGNLTVSYGNRLGKTVLLNSINATYKSASCSATLNSNIGPNAQYVTTIPCPTFGGLTSKATYNIALDFNYTDPDSGLWHFDSGTLFGIVE
jgi:hypothetical protein